MKYPLISVIIACYNSQNHIKRCLDAVLQSQNVDFEVIVVDDGSTDKTKLIIEEYKQPKLQALVFEKNCGPAHARNQAAQKALGKYLFFLDSDTEIDKLCLAETVTAFESDKTLGATQALLLNAETKKIESVGHFLTFFGFPYEIDSIEEIHKFPQHNNYIFGAKTAGMGIRKNLFEKIGGFDEDYLIYGEDTDLSWRVWLSGYTMRLIPNAIVYHYQKGSLTDKTKYRIFYEGSKNSIANSIKNATIPQIIYLLPLQIIAWKFLLLKLLLLGQFANAWQIYRGLWWNIIHLNYTLQKRYNIQVDKKNTLNKIIFGPVSVRQLLLKGWRWFRYV